MLSVFVFLVALFGVGLVIRNDRRDRRLVRQETERMEAEAERVRAHARTVIAEARATIAAVHHYAGTEQIDCLEVWYRLPAHVPPHEVA